MSEMCHRQIHINGQHTFFLSEVIIVSRFITSHKCMRGINSLYLADHSIQVFWETEEDNQARKEKDSDQKLRNRHRRFSRRRRRLRAHFKILLQQWQRSHHSCQRLLAALLRVFSGHDRKGIKIQSFASNPRVSRRDFLLVVERCPHQPQELRAFLRLRRIMWPNREAHVLIASQDCTEIRREFPLLLVALVVFLAGDSS